MKLSPREKGLLFIFLYCCVALLILFFSIPPLTAMSKSPVGSILFVSGASISVLGGSLIMIGNKEVDEIFCLWETEKIHESKSGPSTVLYPFHLVEPAVIKGHVSGKIGPFEVAVEDFFETQGVLVAGECELRPKTYFKSGRAGLEIEIGPLKLSSGSYVLRFGEYPHTIEASFTLTGTYRKKPYEEFYHLGLTLLEVGIPVFITGVISAGYGTSL